MKRIRVFLLLQSVIITLALAQSTNRWSVQKANEWSKRWGWLRGCNYQPHTAINQLEMFQAETFDPVSIDRELGWAEDLGFNCMRVFLHHVAWEVDKQGFKNRMKRYLDISWKHHIATIFVFFDDCWNPVYHSGKQPDPKPGVHNSGWVADPGNLIYEKPELMTELKTYVKDILKTFAKDKRIAMWDLYNEPGNSGFGNKSMNLLKNVFAWASQIRPSQALTVGAWADDLKEYNKFQVENSDVISYHCYAKPEEHQHAIDTLKRYGRPIVCTEYMARKQGSLFSNIMPILKKENVGAINWGFISGKTNTIYAWSTPIPSGEEPKLWFHDIIRKDGTPFSQEEVDLIKHLTGKTK